MQSNDHEVIFLSVLNKDVHAYMYAWSAKSISLCVIGPYQKHRCVCAHVCTYMSACVRECAHTLVWMCVCLQGFVIHL